MSPLVDWHWPPCCCQSLDDGLAVKSMYHHILDFDPLGYSAEAHSVNYLSKLG